MPVDVEQDEPVAGAVEMPVEPLGDAERADATIRYLERSLRCVIDAIGTKAQAYEIDIAEGLLQP